MSVCPYLGMRDDATIMLSEPSQMHRCFAEAKQRSPALDFQARYCLGSHHEECPVYRIAGPKQSPVRVEANGRFSQPRPRRMPLILATTILLVGLTVAAYVVSGQATLPAGSDLLAEELPAANSGRTPEQSPPPEETVAPGTERAPGAPASFAGQATSAGMEPTATPFLDRRTTPTGNDEVRTLHLIPAANQVGWLDSTTDFAEWGDSFLYAGSLGEASLISGIRFDLSHVDRSAPLLGGSLQLTGLHDSRLDSSQGGLWRVQVIAQDELESLTDADFMMLYGAPASIATLRDLTPADLGRGKTNKWELTGFELDWLAKQILDGATSLIVRIIQVPDKQGDTLFAWDSGAGDRSNGNPPMLSLTIGSVPATPPLSTREYLVATFTPAPQSMLTLVPQQQTATMMASK